MNFVAIDVETANADMASICQIGLVKFMNGVLAEEWKTYVDPQDYFDAINVSIHGIAESTVAGAPTFPELAGTLHSYLNNQLAVCHTHFDRVAIRQAFDESALPHPNCVWLDSARVARRTWSEFAWKGYGLGNICQFLGYSFVAHDALEDAKASAHVLMSAVQQTGVNVESWLRRVEQPIDPSKSCQPKMIHRDGNPDGALFGEVIVFTGALRMPRHEAADLAAKLGCSVACGVTKDTTLLVVGDQDIKRLSGHQKSSKHRKAENLISKGQEIRILQESDFKHLVDSEA